MALSVVSEPLKSNAGITDSNVLAVRTQALYEFLEDALGTFTNYRIEFVLKDGIGLTEIGDPFYYVPKSDGTLKVDLASIYLFGLDFYGFNSNLFRIDYRPLYDGSATSLTPLTTIQAIRSKRQILTSGGSNLVNYLLYDNKPDNAFLTRFTNFKCWQNWAKNIQFIWDSEAGARVGNTIRFKVDRLDINKGFLGNLSNTPSTIATASIANRIVKAQTTVIANFLQVYIQNDLETIDLADRVDAIVEDECSNPIMVEWVNSLGGIEEYLFSFNQEIEEVAEVGETIIPPIVDDIEDVDTAIKRDVDITRQFITCFAQNISIEDIRALHEIKHSEEVRVWIDKGGSLRSPQVIVEDIYSTQYNTRGTGFDFTLKLRMPDNFDFFEAKTY